MKRDFYLFFAALLQDIVFKGFNNISIKNNLSLDSSFVNAYLFSLVLEMLDDELNRDHIISGSRHNHISSVHRRSYIFIKTSLHKAIVLV